MKKEIHPKYNENVTATCSCGNTFITGSVLPEIKTEICSACHPFYTGKQKLVDSARRVEKFKEKLAAKKELTSVRKGKKVKRAARAEKAEAKAKAKK